MRVVFTGQRLLNNDLRNDRFTIRRSHCEKVNLVTAPVPDGVAHNAEGHAGPGKLGVQRAQQVHRVGLGQGGAGAKARHGGVRRRDGAKVLLHHALVAAHLVEASTTSRF